MEGTYKMMLLAGGMLLWGSAAACEADRSMEQFRADALARIHAENEASLQRNLQRNLSALLEINRQTYLAAHPSGMEGAAHAASAP